MAEQPNTCAAADERPVRVLLIDDSLTLGTLLRQRLAQSEGAPFQLTCAVTVAEAERLASVDRWDVVILDLVLPDGAYREVFDRLRAVAPDVPVVVYTGADDFATQDAFARLGVDAYLVKGSSDGDTLIGALRKAARRGG